MSFSLTPAAQLVDGAWSTPDDELELELTDPATGAPLQRQAATSLANVERALQASWSIHRRDPDGIGDPKARAAALHAAADALAAAADRIAEQDAVNSGVPISVTRLFAGALPDTFRGAADRIAELDPVDLSRDGRTVILHRLPLGPAAVLAPWNAPTAVAGKKAAFAWAAGCAVIVKPSPWAPNGTILMIEAMQRAAAEAGLPPAAVQLVLGGAEVGQALARSRYTRALSFTGSRRGGEAVAAAAAVGVTATQLELGSNNPAIVLADADVAATATQLAAGMTKLNGAWCESPGTVYVPAALLEPLVAALVGELERLHIGPPLDPATTFGPQANPDQWAGVHARVTAFAGAGARIVAVGALPDSGRWTAPTLVVDAPAELVGAEVFGPVLVLQTYREVDEAIDRTFELATGLGGYVFAGSRDEALRIGRRLPAGEIKINGTSLLDMTPRSAQAFWYGSGVGGHGDAELLRFFTGARIVGEDVDSPL